MFPTETVAFAPRIDTEPDRYGNRPRAWADPVEVPGCLVAPADGQAAREDGDPDGYELAFTIYVDASQCPPLRGARAIVRGTECLVDGWPEPWAETGLPWKRSREELPFTRNACLCR